MWYRWSVKAPSMTIRDSQETIASIASAHILLDTSPLINTEHEVFVPESQYPQRLNTPKSDLSIDFLLHTSLRQRRVRTVDRVNWRKGIEGRQPSPVLFNPTTPILWSDDSLFKFMENENDNVNIIPRRLSCALMDLNTQILFDSPEDSFDKENIEEGDYSGHEAVILPASFEDPVFNRVISSPLNQSPPLKQSELESKNIPKFRSTPPTTVRKGSKDRRVSFASHQVHSDASTGSLLSSIDNGRLEKKCSDRQQLRVVSTSTIKYTIPTPLKISSKKNSKKSNNMSVKKIKHHEKLEKNHIKPPEVFAEQHFLENVVWARWKPDRSQLYVTADLVEQTGTSRRSQWKARIHANRQTSTQVTLKQSDFIPIDPRKAYQVRLIKKRDLVAVLDGWESKKVARIKFPDGAVITVPSRHLILDEPLEENMIFNGMKSATQSTLNYSTIFENDLALKLNCNHAAKLFSSSISEESNLLFESLSFIITCGNDKKDQHKRETLVKLVQKYGGQVAEAFPQNCHSSYILIATEAKRTFKYLMSVIHKLPRLTPQWLVDSIEQSALLPYDPYAVDDSALSFSPCSQINLSETKPLSALKWTVNGSERFRSEFSIILEALGAVMVLEEAEYELCESKSKCKNGISAENFVDCILSHSFTKAFEYT